MKSLRVRLFLSHLAVSAGVVGAGVAFIVLVWYPPPLAQLEGIFKILLVMALVDVCAGPLCTLVVASPKKTRGHLVRDLAVIGLVQLCALGYALYTTFIARPAYIVYNLGQFDVEHAGDLKPEELAKAAPEFASVPRLGPVYVWAPLPDDPKEASRIVSSALTTGFDITDMPRYYRSWPPAGVDAFAKGKAVSAIGRPELRDAVTALLKKRAVDESDAVLVPIFGKIEMGTVVVRKSDRAVVGMVPRMAP